MICSNCGNELVEGTALCGYCGAAIEPTYQAFAQPGNYDASQQWAAGPDMGFGEQPQFGYANQPVSGYDAGYGGQPQAGYDTQVQSSHGMPQFGYDIQAQAGYGAMQTSYDTQTQAGYGAEQSPYQVQQSPYQGQQASYQVEQSPYQVSQVQYQYDAAQPPGAYPGQPYDGMPAQAYGAAPPPQTAKKSKTGLIVGVVAAAVLVLAVIGVGAFFLAQNLTADAPRPITTPGPDPAPTPGVVPQPEPKPEPTTDPPASPSSGSKIDPNILLADFENPYVILDEAKIKITIDIGSGERDDSKYSYGVRCVVENKIDKEFRLMVNDASGTNFTGKGYSVLLMKDYIAGNTEHNSSIYFQPGGNLAYFDFMNEDVEGRMTDFKCTINLSDIESLDTIAEYKITIPEM